MGVLPCNRGDCSNIMCDRYSFKHGYICNNCFEELVKLGIQTDIDKFMGSKVTTNEMEEANAHEHFNEVFPDGRHTG